MNEVQKLQLIGQLGSPCREEKLLAWLELYKQEQQGAYRSFFAGIGKLSGVRDEMIADRLCDDLYDKLVDQLVKKRLVLPNLNAYRSYIYKTKRSVLGEYGRQRKKAYKNRHKIQDPPQVGRQIEQEIEQKTEDEIDFAERRPAIFDQPSIRSNPRLLMITSLYSSGYDDTQVQELLPVSYSTMLRDKKKIAGITRKMRTEDKSSIQPEPKLAEWNYPAPPGDLGLTFMGRYPNLSPHSERELRKLHGIKSGVAIGDVLMPFLIIMGINRPEPMVRMYFLERRALSRDAVAQDPLIYSEHGIVFHQEKVKGKKERRIDLIYNGELTAKLIDAKLFPDGTVNLLVMKYDFLSGSRIVNKMMGGKQEHMFRQAQDVKTILFSSHPALD